MYELRAQPQLIKYYHAAAGFPTKLTWLKAIKNGHYQSWKGLAVEAVQRHFPEAIETWKGHGCKNKMNLRSTKLKIQDEEEEVNKPVGALEELKGNYHLNFYRFLT